MEELLAIIKQQAAVNQQLTNELALLREQVAYLTQKLYGKSSEKVVHQPGQLSLFEEEPLLEEDANLPR
ncbi:hypothetical protein J5M87_04855 [Streptococcus sp. zg-86]|uniref:IS66 family transposase n=1 Tax=Streptococcus zhangguiae TaxID=2664091 RepID=UPI001AD67810|nr:hypothetical protein [Streptococcus sp. zg-86]QTH48653.1 hypothetical protein J5M87_04855 [Streptococcus sp. zg-86]